MKKSMFKLATCWVMLTLLCATPASAWRWNEVASEVVLGPKATSDDIQTALNNLPESGGTVILKSGVYSVIHPICLSRDNLTLRGTGATTILRLADTANCPVVIMGSISNYPTEVVKNLRVCDLDVDGNRDNQQVECWNIQGEGDEIRNNGLTIRSVCDASVERVRSYRCRSGGLVTEKGVRRLTVSDYAAWTTISTVWRPMSPKTASLPRWFCAITTARVSRSTTSSTTTPSPTSSSPTMGAAFSCAIPGRTCFRA